MTPTLALDLPAQMYGYVDRRVLSAGERDGWEPAIWYGVTLPLNRSVGLSVLLACGACYREVPPSAWAFTESPETHWPIEAAVAWDNFGGQAQAIEYRYLREIPVRLLRSGLTGSYAWTLEFGEDGFSRYPEQSKCLHAIELDNGRLTLQPNDRLLFRDASFSDPEPDPAWLRRNTEAWGVETWPSR